MTEPTPEKFNLSPARIEHSKIRGRKIGLIAAGATITIGSALGAAFVVDQYHRGMQQVVETPDVTSQQIDRAEARLLYESAAVGSILLVPTLIAGAFAYEYGRNVSQQIYLANHIQMRHPE